MLMGPYCFHAADPSIDDDDDDSACLIAYQDRTEAAHGSSED
jgi:hypothetical protein